jgi:hypothetical protein
MKIRFLFPIQPTIASDNALGSVVSPRKGEDISSIAGGEKLSPQTNREFKMRIRPILQFRPIAQEATEIKRTANVWRYGERGKKPMVSEIPTDSGMR